MSRCCNACKTPYFCGNKFCWCHAFQIDDSSLAGQPTYPDPTGNEAVRNISKRKQQRMNRRQK